MENVADDKELTSEEFWKFMFDQFNNWQKEDRFDRRVDIDGKNYKISFFTENHRDDVMYIKIIRRTPTPDGTT